MKRDYVILFTICCLVLLIGVIVGTVTVPKGQGLRYPHNVKCC